MHTVARVLQNLVTAAWLPRLPLSLHPSSSSERPGAGVNVVGVAIMLISCPPFQCERQAALGVLHSRLFDPSSPPVVAVIGAGCALSTVAMAEVSQYYNLSMVTQ